MFATSVPLGVVPSAPRWPSWKIHTSAPNAAVSDSTLHISAFSGSTTLPVSRNSSTNVMAAISPSTSGSRSVTASTLSRLTCATPPISTDRPAGPATWCNRVELGVVGLRKQRRRAAHGQECAAVGQPGGRRRWPHPVSAHERPVRGRYRRHVGDPRQVGGVLVQIRRAQAAGIGDDDGHRRRGVVRETAAQLVTDLMRRRRTRQHPVVRETPLHREERKPEQQQQRDDGQPDRQPSGASRTCSTGTRTAARPVCAPVRGGRSNRRTSRRTFSASSRGPSSTIAAGVTTMDAVATKATVATPA